MPKKSEKIQEPPLAEELRAMRAGLLSIDSVLHAADSSSLPTSADEKSEWLTWLMLSSSWGEIVKNQYLSLFTSVRATGVSVIAQRGKFHTQYYLRGIKDGVRTSTRISLQGLRPPKPSVRANPLWWWESPEYLKILKAVRVAVQERFDAFETLMIQSEAAKAAFAAGQAATICLNFVTEWMKEEEFRNPGEDPKKDALKVFGMPKESLSKCIPAFEEFGIDLPKLMYKMGFRSKFLKRLGIEALPMDPVLLGAAMDRVTARENYDGKWVSDELKK